MELLIKLLQICGAVLATIFIGILKDEVAILLTKLPNRILKAASDRVPDDLREEIHNEWVGDIYEYESRFAKVSRSIGFYLAANRIMVDNLSVAMVDHKLNQINKVTWSIVLVQFAADYAKGYSLLIDAFIDVAKFLLIVPLCWIFYWQWLLFAPWFREFRNLGRQLRQLK